MDLLGCLADFEALDILKKKENMNIKEMAFYLMIAALMIFAWYLIIVDPTNIYAERIVWLCLTVAWLAVGLFFKTEPVITSQEVKTEEDDLLTELLGDEQSK